MSTHAEKRRRRQDRHADERRRDAHARQWGMRPMLAHMVSRLAGYRMPAGLLAGSAGAVLTDGSGRNTSSHYGAMYGVSP